MFQTENFTDRPVHTCILFLSCMFCHVVGIKQSTYGLLDQHSTT